MIYRENINEKTKGAFRTFLSSLQNNNKNYRSLHNLTQQIEHQYSGRFLIELLQNAHDALSEEESSNKKQRIEFYLSEEESEFGVLYVANDGHPFSDSNFNALSDLGLSDKDPEKSIGNKGIGFRSVLEICSTPEIYSRSHADSLHFDGYCFTFNSRLIEQFGDPIMRLLKTSESIPYPLAEEDLFIHWSDSEREEFQRRCGGWDIRKLREEMSFLSPYSLPFFLDESTPQVVKYAKNGYSTVIRLPLNNSDAVVLVKKKLEEIELKTILFLKRVNEFYLRINGKTTLFKRSQLHSPQNGMDGYRVSLSEYQGFPNSQLSNPLEYYYWDRTIGGSSNPKEKVEIQKVVESLPGKWPELKQVTISIASAITEDPTAGVFNIFLPTLIETGCHSHFSAPFYGDMSRTDIDFSESKPYNQLVLRTFAETAIDIVQAYLSDGSVKDSAAIIDLLSPTVGQSGNRWWTEIIEAADRKKINLKNLQLILSNKGWIPISDVTLYQDDTQLSLIDAKSFRKHSKNPVMNEDLDVRKTLVEGLANAIELDITPTLSELANTVESIAQSYHANVTTPDWNEFWNDLDLLFGHNTEPLFNKFIVLGSDGELHAVSDDCSIFFSPRSLIENDEPDVTEDVKNIPRTLQPHIAFLHESLQTTYVDDNNRRRKTRLYNFLEQNYIETFSVEPILRRVLQLIANELPIMHSGNKASVCKDILIWGLGLLAKSRSRETSIPHLKRLPVPCHGGWYPLSDTVFGEGWDNTFGKDVVTFLKQANSDSSQLLLNRVLVPPNNELWQGVGEKHKSLLIQGGVFDGIPLLEEDSGEWDNTFHISGWSSISIPETPPKGFSDTLWSSYAGFISENQEPKFDGTFPYTLDNIYHFPGLESYESHGLIHKERLMKLILKSLPKWNTKFEGWRRSRITKKGGNWDQRHVRSPLLYFLQETKWLCTLVNNTEEYFRPRDKWYIPLPILGGNRHQFLHLHPYPDDIASVLDADEQLVDQLKILHMPRFESRPDETTSDSRLLEDLATANLERRDEISNKSTFLGQVRTAWRQFAPNSSIQFPEGVIVHGGSKGFITVHPRREDEIYLPNAIQAIHDGLDLHGKPVVAGIRTNDAKRLKDLFNDSYPESITFASELKITPLVDSLIWEPDGSEKSFIQEFPDLPIILLSIFAFYGDNNVGIGKTFVDALDNLRAANIMWVSSLEAGLWKGENLIAKTPINSIWVKDKKKVNAIIAQREAKFDLGMLSNALSSLMNRNDLDIPLQQFFSRVNSTELDYASDALARLTELRITEDYIAEVRQKWLGDLEWTSRLCKMIVSHFTTGMDLSAFDSIESYGQLRDLVGTHEVSEIGNEEIIPFVKEFCDVRSLGWQLFEKYGESTELHKWNITIAYFGYPELKNENAKTEFASVYSSLKMLLFSIVAFSLSSGKILESFEKCRTMINMVKCPDEYSRKYWEVNFTHVAPVVVKILADIGVDQDLTAPILQAGTVDIAIKVVHEIIPDLYHDPISLHGRNKRLQHHVMQELVSYAIVWSLKSEIEFAFWEKDTEELSGRAFHDESNDMFLVQFDEGMCLSRIKEEFLERINPSFSRAIQESEKLSTLKGRLGLTEEDFKAAQTRLLEYSQRQVRLKNTVMVCGQEFYNEDNHYSDLFDLLDRNIDIKDLPEIDLDTNAPISEIAPAISGSRQSRGSFTKGRGRGRKPNALWNLIGLVGEIHAFRILQKKYGASHVTSNDWKSSNSQYVFPGNEVDDGLGCDFIIQRDGKIYYIEVKSTEGSDTIFELGSSEIELAMDKSTSRKHIFKILHVMNTLSDRPHTFILPNPYNKKYRKRYRFENSGLRVRYSI